jgi:hypothetical protein
MEQMPIKVEDRLTNEVLKEAGRLKSKYKLSLADSIAIAESIVNNGSLVTADHHEIEPVKATENINVTWFREKNVMKSNQLHITNGVCKHGNNLTVTPNETEN